MKIRNVLITMAALAVAASAFALPPGEPPPEPPPEPPKLNDCSPGFWKNHQEWWVGPGLFCDSEECVGLVMDDLKSKGKGSDDTRHDAADALNSWADGHYGYLICTD